MTPNFQRIKDALTQHCLDSMNNIYTITVDDVMDYIEKELSPAMKAQLAALDEVSLAIEIADTIGNVGIVELVEGAICEAIKTQIVIAREGEAEAAVEAANESKPIEDV
jgi:hypothetical protein